MTDEGQAPPAFLRLSTEVLSTLGPLNFESPSDLIKMQILVQAVWVRTRFSFSNLLRGDADAAGCGPRLQGEVSTGFPLKVPKGLKPELPTSRPSSVACSYWSSLLPCLTTCLWLPRVTFQINHLFCTQVLALTWEHPRKTLSFTDEPH